LDLHYDVKIRAAQLLMDNVDRTFVTPVFNGSASLRDAAGQLIEEVTKGIRRKKTVDDAFVDKLYSDMISRYHLDLEGSSTLDGKKQDLGPLPATAVTLLSGLGIAWGVLAILAVANEIKKRKIANSSRKD
jgi:multiple sugar transport system substrate-binding protein